jgi:hypothetical protein
MKQTTASLTLKGVARMSMKSRNELADWLQMHVNDLKKDGGGYAPHFRGSYITNKF